MDNKHYNEYTYQTYKRTLSGFWSDPMHNYKSCPVHRKTRIKRLTNTKPNLYDTAMTSKDKMKTKRKKMVLSVISSACHDRYFKHSKTEDDKDVPSIETVPVRAAQESKDDNLCPIYVRIGSGAPFLIHAKTLHQGVSYEDVLKKSNVDKKEIMLTLNGKMVKDGKTLQTKPYDTLLLLIKGKGGMQESEKVQITKDSSLADVLKWLRDSVGLSEDHLKKFSSFKYFNGESVFMYEDTDWFDLASDLQIPIGLARKILILRNETDIDKKIKDLPIWRFSAADLGMFIRDTMNIEDDPDINNICKVIEDSFVDGIVFLSYKSPKDMQIDIHKENVHGVVYRKVFLRRDKLVNEALETNCQSASTQKDSNNVTATASIIQQESGELNLCSKSLSEKLSQLSFVVKNDNDESFKNRENVLNLPTESALVDVETPLKSIGFETKNQSEPLFSKSIKTLPAPEETTVEPHGHLNQQHGFYPPVCQKEEKHFKTTEMSKMNLQLKEGTSNETGWQCLFQKLFLLSTENDGDNSIDCNMCTIHCNWTKPNELEKRILFILISDINNFSTDGAKKTIWDRIRKNMNIWYKHLTEEDKKVFSTCSKKTQHDESLMYNNKEISLPVSPLKIRAMKEKSLEDYCKFPNIFVLVDKTIIKPKAVCYRTNLLKEGIRRKCLSDFVFDPNHKYWLFDPTDLAFGFQLKYIDTDSCGQLKTNHKSQNSTFCVKSEPTVEVEKIKSIDPEVKAEINDDHMEIILQRCRNFKDNDSAIQYHERWILSTPEHDGAVSYRCFEYKFITDSVLKKGVYHTSRFINIETTRFACGCLNARKNGTIVFGIGDEQNKEHLHAEIVGFPVIGTDKDFRVNITESLRQSIKGCFQVHQQDVALKCIGNPVFIEVLSQQATTKRFVVEIDVEPSSYFCGNECFKINRSLLPDCGLRKIEREYTCYVREKTGTSAKIKTDLKLFIYTELNGLIRRREDEENERKAFSEETIELPMDKLRRRLCNGSNKFDQSIWPILIINKPGDSHKQNDQWHHSFRFLKFFRFQAVFDFDERSNIDGLCLLIRNEEKSILLDEDIFQEYTGRKNDLAMKLKFPHDMKTAWIFSNGRSDLQQPKPHLNGSEWTNVYSAGIRDAVIFYSQKDITPQGRAIVIILLLSAEFDGVMETFREIVVRFGWKQIVVISKDEILEQFIREYKGMEDNIRDCSISGKGITWDHVNATFLEIAGCEEGGTVYIVTSSGVSVQADEKFVETLSDIQILSSKQCEKKKFKSAEERTKFAHEKEIQFYKGNKVDWFNYFFKDQVLQRHCFERLIKTIGNILQLSPAGNRQTKIISTIIISHEPGAGGSTLARHILWEFRAKYRCAIIRKITDRTAINILALWQHKEKCNARPMLLLIDDLQWSEYEFEDLKRQLYIEYRSNCFSEELVCCFLMCQREEQVNSPSPSDFSFQSNSGDIIEPLKQQLTEEEVNWMQEKHEKMESCRSDFKHDYLISFMILRAGFNQEYIKNTIKRFLTKLDIDCNEFELLEYTALLSTYVPTSKRGPSPFIPLECCDELMGLSTMKTISWNRTMSDVLRIFLIIEPKEHASGMQIRMAHPALAEAVLSEILSKKNQTLGELTIRFLNSSIINCQSHARGMIVDFTKEMLKRRLKEEYNDSKTTLFSPLIEEICKRDGWKVAVDVLKLGFNQFNDSYIAQTLARLCVKHKDFQEAEKWARSAVDMSFNNKTAYSYSHFTLATVLEDEFKSKTRSIDLISPFAAVKYISLILESLEHFKIASSLKVGSEDHLLYPVKGILTTIVTCVKFITENVTFSSEIDVRKIFISPDYCPEEIKPFEKFRTIFPTLIKLGEDAFDKIEQSLCFFTTFYAHESTTACGRKAIEHRLYRNLQYKYPELFNDFRQFFGAFPNECPDSPIPEVINDWHRRRLLQLGGNTYMNICNIFREMRKKPHFKAANAIDRCIEMKSHLMKITNRNSKDLANLVSVNFVLGLLGGPKRDSTEKILEYCKQIIKMKRGFEDVANFYISILLWPTNKIDIAYDDDLFYKSLNYLNRDREIKHDRPRATYFTVMKEEKNITQATTQYFLSKGTGFKSLCHRSDIFFREQPESDFGNTLWANQKMKNNLKQLRGQLKICKGKCQIRMKNDKSDDRDRFIEIRQIRSFTKEFLSEEDVYFYLGFSIAGPIAYNVQPVRYEVEQHCDDSTIVSDSVEEYLGKSEADLEKLLKTIEDLKSKRRNGRRIATRDLELLKSEDDIRTALSVKRDDECYPL